MPRRPRNSTLTAIRNVHVGHWTAPAAKATGCTVIDLPRPSVVTAEVRGGAPGSREYALLQSGMTVERADAIVLSGGSAFGLAAADGVMTALKASDRGYPTSAGPVPIVPAAVVFDRMVGDPDAAPTARAGAAALRAASAAPVPLGAVGAGAGCTIGQWRGTPQPAGVGSSVATVGGVSVGALVVLNATGDVFDLDGTPLSGGPHRPGVPAALAQAGENTTLIVVATNTRLDRPELARVIIRAHDALGACVRPAHTRYDGDICFAISSPGRRQAPDAAADLAGEAAFAAVGQALASVFR